MSSSENPTEEIVSIEKTVLHKSKHGTITCLQKKSKKIV